MSSSKAPLPPRKVLWDKLKPQVSAVSLNYVHNDNHLLNQVFYFSPSIVMHCMLVPKCISNQTVEYNKQNLIVFIDMKGLK